MRQSPATPSRYLVDVSNPARLAAWAAVIGVSERALAGAAARVQKHRRFVQLMQPLPHQSIPESAREHSGQTSY